MRKRKIWIMTLFPEFFLPLKEAGVLRRAFADDHELHLVQIRDYAIGNYKSVDDYPFGGAPGMIMRPDILQRALLDGVVAAGAYSDLKKDLHVIYTSPRGEPMSSALAKTLALTTLPAKDLVFLCGRYEGVDERFLKLYVDQEISLGDFVLSGGEIAVMAILDALLRQVPGVLGNSEGLIQESFEHNLLEAPQYTKPREFAGLEVPAVYLSGHHAEMKKAMTLASERLTKEKRPDLFERYLSSRSTREQKK